MSLTDLPPQRESKRADAKMAVMVNFPFSETSQFVSVTSGSRPIRWIFCPSQNRHKITF
jgi:hypothetical protein